ncbi:MAG: hypothetical protein A2075_00965 [Geobacteraceae bacterium GWC2_58_44]|nr:MAG: hypothetical protein A2075_00965 [Geobacteraceae bacterium GWC2_58_44]HBG07412.1 pilus assembly protein TadE [Geobacter sp.]
MKSRPCPKLSGSNGQSVIELALVLPLLVLLMLGLVDLSRAIQAYNIIANVSREGADLALRSSTSIDPQAIMNSLANTAQPLSMSSKGMMYVIKVRKVKGSITVEKTAWQNRSVPNSTFDAKSVSSILLKDGDTLYVFEVFYKYDSLFNPGGSYKVFSPLLHSISVF